MADYVYSRYFGNYTLVRNGESKQAKANWQRALNDQGYNCGTVDGIFGSKTEAQTIAFQKAHHLTADGKAGRNTKMAMFNLYFDADGYLTLGNICRRLTDEQMNGTDEYDPYQQ